MSKEIVLSPTSTKTTFDESFIDKIDTIRQRYESKIEAKDA